MFNFMVLNYFSSFAALPLVETVNNLEKNLKLPHTFLLAKNLVALKKKKNFLYMVEKSHTVNIHVGVHQPTKLGHGLYNYSPRKIHEDNSSLCILVI